MNNSAKQISFVFASIVLLSSCTLSSPPQSANNPSVLAGKEGGQVNTERKMPKIPLKASVLDAGKKLTEEEEMNQLLTEINKDIQPINISEDDIKRGWYLGNEKDKKYGTPDSWTWVSEGKNSRWTSPDGLKELAADKMATLCRETEGEYIKSCLDTEKTGCEYIPESKCKCPEDTEWKEETGCTVITEE